MSFFSSIRDFLMDFPENQVINLEERVDSLITWLNETFNFIWDPLTLFLQHFAGTIGDILGFFPWSFYVVVLFIAGWRLTSLKTGILMGVLTLLIAVIGYWDEMILTLNIVLAGVILSIVLGLPFGIIMAKSKRLETVIRPVLDTMQTLPAYAYLIPALLFFGFGRAPGIVAVTIFAVVPLIRLTYLGITNIPTETKEAGIAFGSDTFQMLFKIELPQAIKSIATGINQTTMMAVSMVVLAAMIGGEGVGQTGVARILYTSVLQQKADTAVISGFVLVFLAIVLDRLIQGMADRTNKEAN